MALSKFFSFLLERGGLTCYVARVGLELLIFLSISQVLGLLAYATMLCIHFLKIITLLFLDVVVIPIYGGHVLRKGEMAYPKPHCWLKEVPKARALC